MTPPPQLLWEYMAGGLRIIFVDVRVAAMF